MRSITSIDYCGGERWMATCDLDQRHDLGEGETERDKRGRERGES